MSSHRERVRGVLTFNDRASCDAISRLQRFPAVNLCFAGAAAPGDFSRAPRGRGLGSSCSAARSTKCGFDIGFFVAHSQWLEADLAWRLISLAAPIAFDDRGLQLRLHWRGRLLWKATGDGIPVLACDLKLERISQTIGSNSFAEQVLRTFDFDFFEERGGCVSNTCFRDLMLRKAGARKRGRYGDGRPKALKTGPSENTRTGLIPALAATPAPEKAAVAAIGEKSVRKKIRRPIRFAHSAIIFATAEKARSMMILQSFVEI